MDSECSLNHRGNKIPPPSYPQSSICRFLWDFQNFPIISPKVTQRKKCWYMYESIQIVVAFGNSIFWNKGHPHQVFNWILLASAREYILFCRIVCTSMFSFWENELYICRLHPSRHIMPQKTINSYARFRSPVSRWQRTCYMSRHMTKPTKWVCAQRRLRLAWASAHSDQSLRCALSG